MDRIVWLSGRQCVRAGRGKLGQQKHDKVSKCNRKNPLASTAHFHCGRWVGRGEPQLNLH